MITVQIIGGLGNQLFQYAFGRDLSLENKTDLALDYYEQLIRTDFEGEKLVRISDVFDLPVKVRLGKWRKDLIGSFNLKLADRLISRLHRMSRCVIEEGNYGQYRGKIGAVRNPYFIGYWQSEGYFAGHKEIVRNDLRFKIEDRVKKLDIYKEITASNSVSLHIRGKDYLTKTLYARCGEEYYLAAIAELTRTNRDLKIFVFTDDKDYVTGHFQGLPANSRIVDVQAGSSPEVVELLLMSKCRHNIIANSSFSWWGAWLNDNPEKIVIAPRQWFADPSHRDENRIVPARWRKI